MRWLDIDLPRTGTDQSFDEKCKAAAAATESIAALQERDGMDAVSVRDRMAEIGRLLFGAVTEARPQAFDATSDDPVRDESSGEEPDVVGYHIVTGSERLDLPWTWLHNGIDFLFVRHPLSCGTDPSCTPDGPEERPWMQRRRRSAFLVGEDGGTGLRAILPQLRPEGARAPELLFIPGHTDRQRRRLIYREAEAIAAALGEAPAGAELAAMQVPDQPVTPSDLCERGMVYQALHFAGPTSQPARLDDPAGEAWMNELIAESAAPGEDELELAAGLEGEVLGIDPVTSLLDDISERYEARAAAGRLEELSVGRRGDSARASAPGNGGSWLLDDGPVEPERLGTRGTVPAFVFSNSHRALPELGARFIGAGASTFVGPLVPLFSRPARLFVSHFYRHLARGWCSGAALWGAAAACRDELGAEHPAWLSYGLRGYGSLALQFL